MELPKQNRPVLDLTRKKFGRLSVIEYVGSKFGNAHWKCLCECGNKVVVMGGHLRSGHTKSCGCFSSETVAIRNRIHGCTNRREYHVWQTMISRCYRSSSKSYLLYGAKGVRVCNRWRKSFETFLEDVGGEIPDGISIDRIDPNGDYEPGNIRLATATQQARNKRNTYRITHNARSLTVPEWAEITGLKQATINYRIRKGWSVYETLETRAISGSNQTLRH